MPVMVSLIILSVSVWEQYTASPRKKFCPPTKTNQIYVLRGGLFWLIFDFKEIEKEAYFHCFTKMNQNKHLFGFPEEDYRLKSGTEGVHS